ncbi:MAG: acetyl-CoA hydrolase/transferase family protein [Thermotogaceae bacterium]|nr:acetyl-CoA hydrolase/transferase family protein [Thermotogaceae bacterium]
MQRNKGVGIVKKWKELYRKKLTSIDDVLKLIKDGATVVAGMTPMEPQVFLSEVHKVNSKNVQIFTCLNMKPYAFFLEKAYEPNITNNSWFYGKPNRDALKEGIRSITYVPNNLHQAGTDLIAARNIDFFVGVASPMDEHGFLTLSASIVYEKDILEAAKTVILEVNPAAPITHGDTSVHITEVDYILEVDYELPEVKPVQPGETEKMIAYNISELVEDGSTIQLGIGAIPDAVARLFKDKKDLGVHTEMLTESMIDLFEMGVITNRNKTLWKGKFVCTFAFGTKRMYEFVNSNPGVMFFRGKYVNDPYIIAQNEKMVSINTALMVDLTGNVCSESIGPRHYSGTGGQLDTHRGAVMSKDGKGIIALKSIAKGGQISTIVPVLPEGSAVTVPRQDVDYVVTEYGVAHLRGRSVRERAKMLIEIAHPDFRDWLKKEAKKLGIL